MSLTRRALVGAALTTALLARAPTAAADPAWVGAGGDAIIIGMGLVYAADVVGFTAADLIATHHGRTYAGFELGLNAPIDALVMGITWRADKDEAIVDAFVGAHTALVIHGAWTLADPTVDSRTTWLAAAAYGTVTNAFFVHDRNAPGTGYDLFELAVNLPIAAGLGYLSITDANRNGAERSFLATGACISTALAVHGLYAALAGTGPQPLPPGHTAFQIAPTTLSDGRVFAFGLGASGSL